MLFKQDSRCHPEPWPAARAGFVMTYTVIKKTDNDINNSALNTLWFIFQFVLLSGQTTQANWRYLQSQNLLKRSALAILNLSEALGLIPSILIILNPSRVKKLMIDL